MKRILALLQLLLLGLCACAQAEAFTPITVEAEDYLNNIDICLSSIGEIELDEGELFSFNELVGSRTEEKGYRSATNGRGVNVVGGGVAQVATTIYMAVKNDEELELTEMHTFGSDFCEEYVPDASAAVFTEYSQDLDFCFVNHGSTKTLHLWRNGSRIYCSIKEERESE